MKRWFSFHNDLGVQLLALYMLVIVPSLIILLAFDQLAGQRIQDDVRTNDLSLARAIAQETHLSITNSLQAVEKLSEYPSVIDADPNGMELVFSIFLDTRPDVNLIYRLDPDGFMLYHYPTGPGSTIGVDFSFRDYYQRALLSDEPLFSKGRISPTTEQAVATAVMPMWSEDHQFLGLVATNIKLASLSQTLADIVSNHRPEEGFQVVILDSSAQIIAYPDAELLLHEAPDLLPEIYAPALAGKSGTRITASPSGEERLYTYAPIPSAGWGVIVSRPTAAAFSTQITIHRITVIVAATFLVLGLVVWILLTLRVITPIERLAAISQSIGTNQKSSPEEREQISRMAKRSDQIGHLIRSILRMEKSIAARITEQETLLETSQAVVSSLDSQIVLDRILEQVQKLLGVKMCAVIALDKQRNAFRIRASRGLSKQYTEQLAIQPTEPRSVTMRALRSKQPIQVSDTESDSSFSAQRPRAQAEGYRSMLAVPLNTQHAPPTALLVFRPDPHVFSTNEIQLLVNFANHVTMAIENAALYTRSDMRLQEQTRRIEALVQSLHDGLILSTLSGNVIYINRRVGELADLSAEDLGSASVDRVLNRIVAKAPEPDKVFRDVEDALKGKKGRSAEIPIMVFGRTTYLRLQVFDVTDGQGIPIGRGLILRDITADRELDRMKSSLISTVSHELRTPLAAIKGYATTLLADDVEWDSKSQREFLSIISSESDRLSNLVNNLLDLSRIEAGSLNLSRVECPIDEVIQHAAERAHLLPDNRFIVELEPNLPTLYADPPRLETVLRNLIENAVKYAGPKAVIRIHVSRKGSSLIFRVKDNGPGIPPEESQHIFQSFYRVDASLTRLASGAGLGLAICQGLVRAHGGDTWVEPQEQGACIAFSIPLNGEPQAEPTNSKEEKRV
ncbi:MAG: GAF domain-containing protein [Chloroflexi bacterium]|nr:GAF domain-containing protein [Chloroflexota bacterium]